MGGRGVLTTQAVTNGAKVSIPCHDLPGDLGRGRPARGDGSLPRCPAPAPGGHQPPECLSGARRRHRHQHGPDPGGGRDRAGRRAGRFGPSPGVQGDRPRLAHGGAGELGRDPLATPAGHVRPHGSGRGVRRGCGRPLRCPGPRVGSGPARRGASGGGDDPDGGRRRGGRGGDRGRREGRHAGRRGRAGPRDGRRRPGPDAGDAARTGAGRCGRRRRYRVPPPARCLLVGRRRHPPAPRALGRARRRSDRSGCGPRGRRMATTGGRTTVGPTRRPTSGTSGTR